MSFVSQYSLYDLRPERYFRYLSPGMNKEIHERISIKKVQCGDQKIDFSNTKYDILDNLLPLAANIYLTEKTRSLSFEYLNLSLIPAAREQLEYSKMYLNFHKTLTDILRKTDNLEYANNKINDTLFGKSSKDQEDSEKKFNNLAVLPSEAFIEGSDDLSAYFVEYNKHYALESEASSPLDGLYGTIYNLGMAVISAIDNDWNKAGNHLLQSFGDATSIIGKFFDFFKEVVLTSFGEYENVYRDPKAKMVAEIITRIVEEVTLALVTMGLANAAIKGSQSANLTLKGINIVNDGPAELFKNKFLKAAVSKPWIALANTKIDYSKTIGENLVDSLPNITTGLLLSAGNDFFQNKVKSFLMSETPSMSKRYKSIVGYGSAINRNDIDAERLIKSGLLEVNKNGELQTTQKGKELFWKSLYASKIGFPAIKTAIGAYLKDSSNNKSTVNNNDIKVNGLISKPAIDAIMGIDIRYLNENPDPALAQDPLTSERPLPIAFDDTNYDTNAMQTTFIYNYQHLYMGRINLSYKGDYTSGSIRRNLLP